MIFVNHFGNSKAAKDYYAHLSQGDYFGKDAHGYVPIFEGKTAELLNLAGMKATQESFYALCENRHPVTGEKLTARDKENRRIMTDMTFDVSKSVTLAALYDQRIDKEVDDAIRETMAEVEANMCVRVRKGGKNEDRVSGNIMYAIWPHETTRPLEDGTVDPHKHRHVTVLNVSNDAQEDILKACQFGNIVRDKRYYQAAFHARLASKLSALSYGIEKDGNSFRIAGIDRATVEKFSRRTGVIEAEAERLGIDDAKSKGELGRRTRRKKSNQPTTLADLRAEWDIRLTPVERRAVKAAGKGLAKGDDAITPLEAKEFALEHSFQNASAVSDKRLMAEALTFGVGSVRPEDVSDIARHPEVIARMREEQLMTTTKSVLHDELSMLQFAKDGQRQCRPFVNVSELNGDLLGGLSAEQTKAALHILGSRDIITGVVGKAGTGKTRLMSSTIAALENGSGQKVFVFAPSAQASRGVLKREGFENAETLEMLLKNEQLQAKVKGQVIWVDEAGLVSSRDMSRLMALAKRAEARVILSGDETQHSSVEAGDAYRLLQSEAGVKLARLTEIRRQSEPGYKKAVEAIAQGSGRAAQKGFDALDRMGCVIEAAGAERHHLLVTDYLEAQSVGKSALIIAPTHVEGERLTTELRNALKERGVLGADHAFASWRSTAWTDAQKRDTRNYEPGMAIAFHQNAKGFTRGDKAVVIAGESGPLLQKQDGTKAALPIDKPERFEVYRVRDIGVSKGERIRITRNALVKVEGQAKTTRLNNGDIFAVEGFTREGEIRLEGGKLLPKGFGHFSYGMVDTSYSSQGKTVDRVYIATGNESLPAVGQQQWYVSASRGREMAKVYVDSKEDVRSAIARTGERLSAVELTGAKLRDSWRNRIAHTLERNRVGRFLKNRAVALVHNWREKGREGVNYA